MTRTKTILLVCFLVTFAAGGAMGWRVTKSEHSGKRHSSWLANELNLSPEQREQMKKIWSDARAAVKQNSEQRSAISQQRDQAIMELLSPDQRAKYEAIQQDYSAKTDQLKEPLNQALEHTKQMLTPEQAQKFEELVKTPRGKKFGMRSHDTAPASMPTTQKQPASRVGE